MQHTQQEQPRPQQPNTKIKQPCRLGMSSSISHVTIANYSPFMTNYSRWQNTVIPVRLVRKFCTIYAARRFFRPPRNLSQDNSLHSISYKVSTMAIPFMTIHGSAPYDNLCHDNSRQALCFQRIELDARLQRKEYHQTF